MVLQREVENDSIQEISRNYYQLASTIFGTITKEKYDGIEDTLNTRLFTIASELATLLLHTRLEKVLNNPNIDKINLLDVEKFILDSNTDMDARKNMIMNGVLRGKSKLLESIATFYSLAQTWHTDRLKQKMYHQFHMIMHQAFISQKIASKIILTNALCICALRLHKLNPC